MFTNAYRKPRTLCEKRQRVGWAVWTGVALGVAVVAQAAAGDTIELKRSVRLPVGARQVRLTDIATITGPAADIHSELVIADVRDHTQAMEIEVQDVRRLLSDAGVHWGKVSLNGRVVIVRPRGPVGSAPPLAMTPVSLQAEPIRAPRAARATYESAASLVERPTLRGEIARAMCRGLNLVPDDLRLTFDARDADFLDTGLESYRFEIQPLSNLDSDHVELGVRAWANGKILHRQSVSVRPMVCKQVAVLKRAVSRGDVMHEEDLNLEARWLTPIYASTTVGLVEAVGRVAGMPLKPGDVLKKKHVKRDLLVKRGDRVIVRCLVGGVVISLDAEAKSDGAEGDRIELRKLGERSTFFGTVSGPGAAMMNTSR